MKANQERLLSAAPALLAALKAIVAEVGGMRPYSTSSWLPAHLVDAAMDAIDRAEGES